MTPLTSAMASWGRYFMNKRKKVPNSPKVPT
jgi:hypothetical protein